MTEQNEKLGSFFNNSFNAFLKAMPEIPALMGIGNIMEFKGLKSGFADYSLQGYEDRIVQISRISEQLHSFDRDSMTPDQQLSYDIYDFFLDYNCFDNQVGKNGDAYVHHSYPIKHKNGVQNDLLILMTNFHDIQDEQDAKAYLSRLSKLKEVLSQLAKGVVAREKKGIILPRVGTDIVLEELKRFLAINVSENNLLVSFRDKLDALSSLDSSIKEDFLAKAEHIIAQDVYPAYENLLAVMTDQSPRCPLQPGAWQLPDGDGYYDYLAKTYTTVDLSVDQIHEIGLQEIKRLHQEMEAGLSASGFYGKPIRELLDALRHDPKYHFPSGDKGRKQILSYYNQLTLDIREKLPQIFDNYPKTDCNVVACPEYLEDKRITNYTPPTIDGTRPGLVELNVGQELLKAKWEMPATAYHEGYPGHHLQLVIAQELEGLPLFRKTIVNSAYIEGWAKYAEILPGRFGFNKDPLCELARKHGELISSVYLAVDTGIHRYRWDREAAIRFYMENAFEDRLAAEYTVDRIIVTPGYTLSYKIGMLKMTQLHDRMKNSLGDQFNIREFHNLVLQNGSIPLFVLENIINNRCR